MEWKCHCTFKLDIAQEQRCHSYCVRCAVSFVRACTIYPTSEICFIATLHLPPSTGPFDRASLPASPKPIDRTIFVLPIFIHLWSPLPVFRRFTYSLTAIIAKTSINFHTRKSHVGWRKKDLNYAHANKLRNIFITCVCIRVVCLSFSSRPGRFSAGQLFFLHCCWLWIMVWWIVNQVQQPFTRRFCIGREKLLESRWTVSKNSRKSWFCAVQPLYSLKMAINLEYYCRGSNI